MLILLASGCASGPSVCQPYTAAYRGIPAAPPQDAEVLVARTPDLADAVPPTANVPSEQTTQRPPEPPTDADDAGPIFLPESGQPPETFSPRLPPAFQEPIGELGTVYPGAWDPITAMPDHGPCCEGFYAYGCDFVHRIGADHVHYYSTENLVDLGAGVALAAILANTAMDQNFRDFYQSQIRNEKTDASCQTLHLPRFLGDGAITIPVLAGAALAEPLFPDSPLAQAAGRWGQRSLRAMLVGWPPLLALQYITGASRPCESPSGSHWDLFKDNNGVSGHSFMGAVPLLTAAMMARRPVFKVGFAFMSTWAGISRINDDRHYLSQVLLGWWMAYLAVRSVEQTEMSAAGIQIVPIVAGDGLGATALMRW